MANLTASRRAAMPSSQFAMAGKRFPMNDPTHQRLAIGGATRSERAGNISPTMANKIKTMARRKLGTDTQDTPADAMHPRQHALAKASATHLRDMGHITDDHHAKIHKSADKQLKLHKGRQPALAASGMKPGESGGEMPFGSFAPR